MVRCAAVRCGALRCAVRCSVVCAVWVGNTRHRILRTLIPPRVHLRVGIDQTSVLDANGNVGISNVNPHATRYKIPNELLKRLRDFYAVSE